MKSEKIAIVEDCEGDRSTLEQTIKRYLDMRGISMEICLFANGEQFLDSYAPGDYKILILDIYMGEITGMDIARLVREREDPCEILFLTTSDEYAVESYEVRAAYYLLKPVDKKKLWKALEICLKDIEKEKKSIQVVADRVTVEIPCSAIYYAESYRNIVEIHLKQRIIKTYMTFHRFAELLNGDRRFLDCNKGCLVNMDHIERMEENEFVLEDQTVLPIRKRGKTQVKTEYLQYLCEKMDGI